MSTNPMDDLFNFNTNVDPNAKNHARPDSGKQICLLKKYWTKNSFKKGTILIADLVIAQPAPGGKHVVGDVVSVAWMISYKGPSGLADTYAKARASEFVRALLGMPENAEAGGQSRRLTEGDQPGTGIAVVVDCDASTQYPSFKFDHIPQTPEQIAAQRAYVLAQPAAPTVPAAMQAPLNPPVQTAPVALPVALPVAAPATQPVYAPPVAAPVYAAPPVTAPAPAAGSPLAFLFPNK